MNGKWQWDDVRFFLAVSREGSLSGAARALGVDHVTVGRRIACHATSLLASKGREIKSHFGAARL